MLIGRSVDNAGDIYGPGGTASLLAADSVLLTTVGGPSGIYVSPGTTASGNVTHTGRIEAAAAALKAARGDVYTLAGSRTGLDATGTKGGSILLGTSAPRHRAGSTSRGRRSWPTAPRSGRAAPKAAASTKPPAAMSRSARFRSIRARVAIGWSIRWISPSTARQRRPSSPRSTRAPTSPSSPTPPARAARAFNLPAMAALWWRPRSSVRVPAR